MSTNVQRKKVREFLSQMGYLEDDRVRAVFIIGSSATGQGDAYSDIDVMIVVSEFISNKERLERLRAAGCHNIMLEIAGVHNPAMPVESQVIDKFVYQDIWFDVSYHSPHQLQFCFDYIPVMDKDGLEAKLCSHGELPGEQDLKARAQADLRLLHARIIRYKKYALREEWIGIDTSVIKNLLVDVVMLLNDHPDYNRFSSRITSLLRGLPVKPSHFEERLSDLLHLDDRAEWARKLEILQALEEELTSLCVERWGPISMYDD